MTQCFLPLYFHHREGSQGLLQYFCHKCTRSALAWIFMEHTVFFKASTRYYCYSQKSFITVFPTNFFLANLINWACIQQNLHRENENQKIKVESQKWGLSLKNMIRGIVSLNLGIYCEKKSQKWELVNFICENPQNEQ